MPSMFILVSRFRLSLPLLSCLLLWACGGGSTSNNPPPQPPPPAVPELFFGSGPSGVSSYTVDTSTAKLSPVSNFPGANFAESIAVTASGKFLYAPENVTPGIEAFSVSSNGTLSEIAGSPFPMPAPRFIIGGIAVDPAGKFLFATDPAFGHVAVYTIAANGALTASSTTFPTGPGGSSPKGILIDPSGKFLYVSNQGGNSLSAFAIDASTGNLTPVSNSPFATSIGMPQPIVIHPNGKFLYTGLTQVGGIDGFSIDQQTGALAKTSSSPFLPQPLPCVASCSLAITPSGKFLYTVTTTTSGDPVIAAYSMDPSTGALAQIQGSPFSPAPPPPQGSSKSPCGPENPLAVDLSGTFLYVGCANPAVMVFSINASTGAITPATGDPSSNFGSATFPTTYGANSAVTIGRVP